MIREAIEKVINRINLSEAETRVVFDEIMSGAATAAQIAAFLTALRMKGETVEEITGAAQGHAGEGSARSFLLGGGDSRYLRYGAAAA